VTRRAWALTGALAALWGASYLFIAIALEDLHPLLIVFVRIALGAAVLLPLAVRRGALAPLRGRLGPVAVVVVVQLLAPFALITYGQEHIASSMAGILVASAPIFTALLAVAVDHEERSTGWGLVGVLVGICGVGLLFGVDLSGASEELLGGAMVLLASLGYAAAALYMKRTLGGIPAVGVAAATLTVGSLALLPTVPFVLPDGVGPGTVAAMVGLGAGGTGVAFLVYYTLIADVGPARASIVAYVAPGFAVVYGVTLLGEAFGVATALGLGLILAGSWSAAERRAPWRRRSPVPVGAGEPAVTSGEARP
jgi:drug/metabolite transporter (DMT)-like permease